MLSAAIARLFLLVLAGNSDVQWAIFIYSFWLVLEKTCLVIGINHFLNLHIKQRRIFKLAALAGCWILFAWGFSIPMWIYGTGLAVFNILVLGFVAVVCFTKQNDVSHQLMRFIIVTCGLLVLHWSVFPFSFFFPAWQMAGFAAGTLLVLVQYFLLLASILFQFQKRLIDAEENALQLAHHDLLTGLTNKYYLNHLFEQALVLANRPHQFLAVIYIDLDNFKPINDSAGHKVGDEVLKEVAKRLKDHLRSTDICARVGGDEFVVIATQLDHVGQVNGVANKLLKQLTQEIQLEGSTYSLGASMGISFYPTHGDNLATLMEVADHAMYCIKRNGKNGYHVAACHETGSHLQAKIGVVGLAD